MTELSDAQIIRNDLIAEYVNIWSDLQSFEKSKLSFAD